MLKYILLGFLSYHSLTGYDLKRLIDQSIANFWHAELSQIYVTLKKLEAEGCITSHIEAQEERPDRRIYTITPTGEEDMRGWLDEPLVEASPIKETLLLRLFFSGSASKETVLTTLRLQRTLHAQKLTYYQTVIPSEMQGKAALLGASPNDLLMWEATRRAGELYEQMYLTWLNELITKVEDDFV